MTFATGLSGLDGLGGLADFPFITDTSFSGELSIGPVDAAAFV